MPSGSAGSTSEERTVLIAGSELALVDRFVSTFRRAGFSVRRILAPAAALKLVAESPLDVIVLVLPFPLAADVMTAVRAEGSPCRRTAVLVVADESAGPEASPLASQANRVLPAAAAPEELLSAAELLLQAAPRVTVAGTARLHLAPGETRTLVLANLSSTGMLLTGSDPPAADAVVGFELAIPSLPAPIRGQAQVLRLRPGARPGEQAVAMNFVSFGGEGAKLLESIVFQERAAAGAQQWTGRPGAAGGDGSRGAVVQIRDAEELALRREELDELAPFLEGLLRQGLAPRMKAAEWYTAAAELGLESLSSFSAILEAVYSGWTKRSDVSQQLADLNSVRTRLGEFVISRDVQRRVDILLEIRQALERLLHALALTGVLTESSASPSQQRGVVAEVVFDVQRLLRFRQLLAALPGRVDELGRPKYIFAKRALQQLADEIHRDYLPWSAELGLETSAPLLAAPGRRDVLAAADREMRRLDQRLTGIHQKIYRAKFRTRASRDRDADLAEAKLTAILVETLAAGSEFLGRAYSAYRHALELTGSDPRLLDRVAGLTVSIAAAESRLGPAPPRR